MNYNLPLVTFELADSHNYNFTISTYNYLSEELLIDVVEANNKDVYIDALIVTGYEHATLHFQNKSHLVSIGLVVFDGIQGSIDGNVFINKTLVFSEQPHLVINNNLPTKDLEIVQRENQDIKTIQKLSKSIISIPGCGEHSLHPELSYNKRASTSYAELKEALPATKDAGLVISWFVNGTNADNSKLMPGRDVGYLDNIEYWTVGNYNDATAYKISKNEAGQTSYGGTPSDSSVVENVKLAHINGLQVMLYPMVQVDDGFKSWRGHITGSSDKLSEFFYKEYRPFIIHYAKLVKDLDGIGSFIIGSEFKGLTKIQAKDGTFPFVDKLVELAAEVKNILGEDVIVTYAADWSEYHTSDGLHRPLDKLWASPSIDVVGIDAYFPITDTYKKHVSNDDIKKGWISGEGYDYYYDDKKIRHSLIGEEWNQWKNLQYWWESHHWVGGNKTEWQPKMKSIWFTEFGAPSISMAGNQPNVFYNPEMRDGGVPKNSDGTVDNTIQRKIIAATLEFFENSTFLTKIFLWNWDARGLGWYKLEYYRDGSLWRFGHWLDDKIISREKYSATFKGDLKFHNILVNATGTLEVAHGSSIEMSADGKLSFYSKGDMTISAGSKVQGGEHNYHSDHNFYQHGLIKTTLNLTINALNVLISGHINSGKDLTIDALEKLTIQTLFRVIQGYNSEKSVVELMASLSAEGAVTLSATSDVLIEGAKVQGDSIKIRSVNGDVKVIPLKLYEEVRTYGKKYYSVYKALKLQRSSLEAANNIYISGANILLSGVISKSALDTDIITLGKTIIDSPSEWIIIETHSWKKKGGISGLFGAKKTSDQYSENQDPVSSMLTAKNLRSISAGDQVWEGAKVKAFTATLKAGTPEHAASITFSSVQKYSHIKVVSTKAGFDFKFKNGQLEVETFRKEVNEQFEVTQIPTIFEIEDSFIGYANGKWVMLSSKIDGNGTVIIDAKDMLLTAAPDLKFSYASVDRGGFGLGFSPKMGEYAIQAGLYYQREEGFTKESTYNQQSGIKGNFVKLSSDKYEDYGAIFTANILQFSTKIEIHGVLKDVSEKYFSKEGGSAGIKFGFKSNLGQIFEGTKAIVEKRYETPESFINSAFEVNKVYDGMLEALSKNSNHGISGGVWFYSDYSKTNSQSAEFTARPTMITVKELLKSESEELRLTGTQYNAYNAYFKTKYLQIRNSENEAFANIDRTNFDVQIPIKGSVPPSLSGLISEANQYQKVILNTKITVTNNLTIDVEGMADMKGVYISAKTIDAIFDELILESVQDIYENSDKYKSMGLGFSKDGLKDIGLQFKDRQRNQHVVNQLSAILGTERANIVVANALRLTGAMIASAQMDTETGLYTDHGHLTLTVGSLFVQHINNYDDGVTIGASLSSKRILDGVSYGDTSTIFATQPIVGNGAVKVGDNEPLPENLGRDVNAVNSKKQKSGIDAIDGYMPDLEHRSELREGISWNPVDTLSSFGQCLQHEVSGLWMSSDFMSNFWKMNGHSEVQEQTSDKEQIFGGIIDDEIGVEKLPPILSEEESKIVNYIKENPKVVSAKLVNLLVEVASENEGKLITKMQRQNVVLKFINEIGGGIIDTENQLGKSAREYSPTIMNIVDKTLETVGNVVMASATGWTLALSDAKSYKEAEWKVVDFIKGVDEILNTYTSKEERKVIEYVVGGLAIKKSLKTIFENDYIAFDDKLLTKTGVALVKDGRLDGYVSGAAHKLLDNLHFKELKTSEVMNAQVKEFYKKPPFIEGGRVGVFETDGSQKFVRMYTEGETRSTGRFWALKDDVVGLTPEQLKDKFDLPHLPTHIAEVTPPKGIEVAVGTVNVKQYGGAGLGTQFYSMEGPDIKWVSNARIMR
jgi:hypothetical protein